MSPALVNRLLLALVLVVAVVGLAEASVHGDWDVFVLFAAIAFVVTVLLLRTFVGRAAISLRRDLVEWLDERAVAGGEPPDRVADRAVSAYRAGLSVDPVTFDDEL